MEVVVVTTLGDGSMDVCGMRLAEALGAPVLALDVRKASAGGFNRPLAEQVAALRADVSVLRQLRHEPRLLHLTNHHLARYGLALDAPYLVTAHDLIRQADLRRTDPYIARLGTSGRLAVRLDWWGIERAAAIVAPSRATKRDLAGAGIPAERISVVHHGLDHAVFRPVERRIVPEPYVLFVGSEHPRKNLETLFRAFALLKRKKQFEELRLVKVGAAGAPEAPFRERTRRFVQELALERDVLFTNRVAAADLPAYYSGARCLALPSLAEGFGLPALEAMACGCPVIVSDAGALPEVVGDAGIVVSPPDARALAAAIAEVVVDDALAADLRARGLRRAAEFSWERAARETSAVYRTVAESRDAGETHSARRRSGKRRSTDPTTRRPASEASTRT